MPNRVDCLAPVINGSTQVLILDSLPGSISVARGEYHAHSRDPFWGLLGAALGISFLPRFAYDNRIRLMQHLGVGIWSAAKSAVRVGFSLVGKLEDVEGIDLLAVIAEEEAEDLKTVFFDGRLAEDIFTKEVYWQLPPYYQNNINFKYLPYSHLDHTGMQFREKARIWGNMIRGELNHFSEKRK